MSPLMTANGHDGVAFNHISCGQSLVDRTWEEPPFASLGDYVRVASLVQAGRDGLMTPERSDVERYQHWAMASRAYCQWEAERLYPSVSRAVSMPDGMFEATDPDGGSLVPPTLIREVFDKARFDDTPFKRCRIIMVPTNVGVFPAYAETSRVDGSRWGGALGYWENEAQQLVNSHPKLANSQFRLKKLTCMIPTSEELFDDASLLDAFVSDTAAKELAFQVNESLINGNGVGRLIGIVNSPACIQVAKDPGQASATISTSNVNNMYLQLHAPSRARSVWYSNEAFDAESLALPVTPMTGWHGEQPAPTLKGRYCYPLEHCGALGSPGDLVLGDWSQYALLLQGIRKNVSFHFRFDYMEGYYRFVLRADGQILWTGPLTPIHGTVTKAPFTVIAPR